MDLKSIRDQTVWVAFTILPIYPPTSLSVERVRLMNLAYPLTYMHSSVCPPAYLRRERRPNSPNNVQDASEVNFRNVFQQCKGLDGNTLSKFNQNQTTLFLKPARGTDLTTTLFSAHRKTFIFQKKCAPTYLADVRECFRDAARATL